MEKNDQEIMQTIFKVSGLDCSSEEKVLRNALKNISGVKNIHCNFVTQELTVEHDFENISIIEKAILKSGLKITVRNNNTKIKSTDHSFLSYKNWILLSVAMGFALTAEIISLIYKTESSILVIIFSIIAILLSGTSTFKKGFIAIKTFTLNINFLMMIAISGAIIIGEWPEAAMVTVLFALAELIERYSLDKARNAVQSLMEMAPEKATVKQSSGTWKIKSISDVIINDIILVKPGERIPLDGRIVKGESSINQAPVTGESMPVEKKPGDTVFSGTINEYGSFEFIVTAISTDTLLSKIIRTVEEAQSKKAPTERFVDLFSKYYTPTMVLIAIIIAIFPPLILKVAFYPWIYKALVMLVIACPCALVISTPVTVVSGLALAARHGVLIKGGEYLEGGYQLKSIAFDKTGTLTEGRPVVTDMISLSNLTENEILRLAASFDVHSEHPIANAIVKKWEENNTEKKLIPIENFNAIPGRGVTGINSIDNQKYFVGNHKLAEENNVCSIAIEEQLRLLEDQGKTTIIISTENEVLGILAVADTVRESSKEAISAIHQFGIKTIMITGDNVITANAIAKIVGIDFVFANMLPNEKLNKIDQLLNQYHRVGMVGDGINDAPALAKSTIGFSMGNTGSDTALETADVVLMQDNLHKLPFFIEISKKTGNILRQNISFSIFVKMIFFILALTGYATLWMAVFADMGASLIVVFNGLRLLKFKTNGKCCNHNT